MFSSFRLYGGHLWKLHGAHQPVHSSDTDVYAIITSEDICDLVCADRFVIIRIDLKDDTLDISILLCSGRRLRAEMLVVGAAVYFKDPAQSLDIMLKTQFMYGV